MCVFSYELFIYFDITILWLESPGTFGKPSKLGHIYPSSERAKSIFASKDLNHQLRMQKQWDIYNSH